MQEENSIRFLFNWSLQQNMYMPYNSEVKSFDQCLPKTTDGALKVSFIYLQSHKPIGISIRNLNSYRKKVFARSLGGSLE